MENIAVVGSTGAIGSALVTLLAHEYPKANIHALARKPQKIDMANVQCHVIDDQNEQTLCEAAETIAKQAPLDMVIVASGVLHFSDQMPEKSLRDLSSEKFQRIFAANTIFPALVAKHFIPRLAKNKTAYFAALSARVGSISDNQLGGWYAYRASKAALNMVIKTAAIETARLRKQAIVVGLHPGTVDSNLSKPFQANVKDEQLFSPDFAAKKLLAVLNQVKAEHSGKCFAWDGKEIAP